MKACKIINLERGLPTVREAMDTLEIEIQLARGNCDVLLFIHGYGRRTQGGGKIKEAVRSELADLKKMHGIADYVFGENFSMFSPSAQKYVPSHPELRQYATGTNLGVTLVIL